MSKENPSRKKFLQLLGLSAGAVLASKSGLANGFDKTEILKLTSDQQTFMNRYEKWMDEFTKEIRIQKTSPEGIEHHKRMIALTEESEQFQPQLEKFMQDETFATIFRISIERMTKEI